VSGRGQYDRNQTKRERRAGQKRAILGAAIQVLASSGWADASVEAVIQKAGVSRRTFYEHFGALDDVLFKIYEKRASRPWPFLLAMTYALGTNMFSLCSQGLWQHGAACLTLLASLWALDRIREGARYEYLLGFFAGLCIAGRTANVLFFAGFMGAAFFQTGLRGWLRFSAGASAPGVS